MNKFIKCWVFIICLLFIFLILFTDRVNAESYTPFYVNNNYLSENIQNNVNLNSNTINVDFMFNNYTNVVSGNFNYLKGNLFLISQTDTITSTNSITLNNINFDLTCSQSSNYVTYPQSNNPTIHYADGTTSYITSWPLVYYMCTEWKQNNLNINGTITTITPNIDNNPQVEMLLFYNNASFYTCSIDTQGQFTCPNPSTNSIYKIRLIIHKRTQINQSFSIGISRTFTYIKSDTQEIINNQNQNAQQQHNDAQQQYDFITNTTIDSNTTSNVNNIDTSNSDTKLAVTNFALIPLNFMQSIINSFSSSCSQVCIGQCGGSSGGGHDNAWRFIFPCLDIESIVGSNIYTIIDSLFAFGMIFAFIRSVRNFFINALLLTTDASSEVGVFL